MNRDTIGEQAQPFFKKVRLSIRLLRRKAIPIAIRWTRARIPEFGDIL